MEIGIIGLPQSGKSTLFQIMTGVNSREIFGEQFVKGVAKVPDARFDKLALIFKPKKVSPATVPFTDISISGKDAWDKARQGLATADGLIHVIEAFDSSDAGELVKRYRQLSDELIFADLIVVENRLERLSKIGNQSKRPEDLIHSKILPKIKETLENGRPLREMEFNPEEKNALRGFTFWTIKPELVVLNTAEGSADAAEEFKKLANISAPVVLICCQIELEISALPKDERGEFLSSLGIETPAFEKVIQTAFSLIGQMSYFTVGEDEVKAWVVPIGSTAPKAAAAIHKDFERGFIKAEVVSYKDFIDCGETLVNAKSKGKQRLEGKEYIVADGDIINFRFNV